MTITVKYGCESYTLTSINAPSIGDIKSNATVRAVLGCSDNTRALIDGIEMPNDVIVPEGSTVVLETRANQKAN